MSVVGLAKGPKVLLALILGIALLALACAKAEEAAKPAPAAPAPAPAAAPAPAPAPAPTAVAAPAPAPAPAAGTEIVVPSKGTGLEIKIDPRTDEPSSTFIENIRKYHNLKLPLWEKAKYGGARTYPTLNDKARYINPFKTLNTGRVQSHGVFFTMDVGTCSLLGRTDFSRCHGVRNNNYQGVLVPMMFEKWGLPDPLTRTFTLRRGILWPAIPPMNRANREVTAEDVKWYFETVKKEGIFKETFAFVDSIEAVDRYNLRLKFSRPEADFLRMLSSGGFAIVAKECYDTPGCLDQTHIGPAPFLFDEGSYVPRTKVVWNRNEEFYLKGLPYLDQLIYLAIVDIAAQRAAFITGKIDVFQTITPKERDSLLAQRPDAQTVAAICACGSNHFAMQMNKKPFDDVRVRRAISMLIDRPASWQACCEGYQAIGMPMAWDYLGLDLPVNLKTAGPYNQYNPEEAKRLLKEAGYEKGFAIDVVTGWLTTYGTGESLAAMERTFKPAGITLNVKAIDFGAYLALKLDKNWDGFYHNVSSGTGITDSVSYLLQTYSKSPQNWQNINDPKLDDLYVKARSELDPQKRQDLLWEFLNYMYDQQYGIHFGSPFGFYHMQPWLLNASIHLYAYIHFALTDWVQFIDPDIKAKFTK
ncbi:MAG: ABC transporter substrate-binding protein [Chloroflexi bacterium]|nr:ABC transporter substrate-binding protein [Chloroflexota bacterium]